MKILNKFEIKIYIAALVFAASILLSLKFKMFLGAVINENFSSFVLIIIIYLMSHVFRLFRLALLGLSQREKLAGLIFAHSVTVLPGSLLMYKFGEIFRIYAFAVALKNEKKALAIWLIERFGDISVITVFIFIMYVLKIKVPDIMRNVFIIFVFLSVAALFAIFAVTKVFAYLNNYLVLESSSRRGLTLLRISYYIKQIEVEIYKAVEGRLAGFFLVSVFIWAMEILALSIFIGLVGGYSNTFPDLFFLALAKSLSSSSAAGLTGFGIYQLIGLIILSFISILIFCFSSLRAAK